MNDLLRLTVFVIAFLFAVGNIYLMTRKKLNERTTILWLFGTVVGLVVAAFPHLLNRAAHLVGVSYPPALLYLVAILVLLTIVIYQSTQIATMDYKLREIGQKVALLEAGMAVGVAVEPPFPVVCEAAAGIEGMRPREHGDA